jgi:hypothetical protein
MVRHERTPTASALPSWARPKGQPLPPPTSSVEELTPRKARIVDILARYIRCINAFRAGDSSLNLQHVPPADITHP